MISSGPLKTVVSSASVSLYGTAITNRLFSSCSRKHGQAARHQHEGPGPIHLRVLDRPLLQLHLGQVRPRQVAEEDLLHQVVQRKLGVLQVSSFAKKLYSVSALYSLGCNLSDFRQIANNAHN